jgi:hypothetical protein
MVQPSTKPGTKPAKQTNKIQRIGKTLLVIEFVVIFETDEVPDGIESFSRNITMKLSSFLHEIPGRKTKTP